MTVPGGRGEVGPGLERKVAASPGPDTRRDERVQYGSLALQLYSAGNDPQRAYALLRRTKTLLLL